MPNHIFICILFTQKLSYVQSTNLNKTLTGLKISSQRFTVLNLLLTLATLLGGQVQYCGQSISELCANVGTRDLHKL